MPTNGTSWIAGILVTALLALQTGISAAAEWKAGDKVVTTTNVPVKVGTRTLTTVPAGTKLTATAVKGDWIAVDVERNGKTISGWIWSGQLTPVDKDNVRHVTSKTDEQVYAEFEAACRSAEQHMGFSLDPKTNKPLPIYIAASQPPPKNYRKKSITGRVSKGMTKAQVRQAIGWPNDYFLKISAGTNPNNLRDDIVQEVWEYENDMLWFDRRRDRLDRIETKTKRKKEQSVSQRLSAGMTKQEVKQIVGLPEDAFQKVSPDKGFEEAWIYKTFTVWFDDKGKLTRVEKH